MFKEMIQKFKVKEELIQTERGIIRIPAVKEEWIILERLGFPDDIVELFKNKQLKVIENIKRADRFIEAKVISQLQYQQFSNIESYINAIKNHAKKPRIRLLVSGVSGSGKTTTIAYIVAKMHKINPFLTFRYITFYDLIEDSSNALSDLEESSIVIIDNLDVFYRSSSNNLYDLISIETKARLVAALLKLYDKGKGIIMTVNEADNNVVMEIIRKLGNESLAQRFEAQINLGKESLRIKFRSEKF